MIDELRNIKSDEKELRKFGISVGSVLVIIGFAIQYLTGNYSAYMVVGGIGAFLLLFGIVYPKILLPLQKLWMSFAVVLGFVMTRVILVVLFYFIVTPVALTAKIFGKDFLELKVDKKKETYWQKRNEEYQKQHTERQF